MDTQKEKLRKRARKHGKIKAKIRLAKKYIRLSVFRSNRGYFVQIIDDKLGKTLVSAHSREIKPAAGEKVSGKITAGFAIGKLIAERALQKKIESVVFDRGGNKYHGRIKAVADGAREGGLKF
jgi:large subunit ribosomal protein L18